jgi:hypothetical protein
MKAGELRSDQREVAIGRVGKNRWKPGDIRDVT